jgi:hypothetical protein
VGLLGQRSYAVTGFVMSPLLEKIMRAAQRSFCHLERPGSTPGEVTSIETENRYACFAL